MMTKFTPETSSNLWSVPFSLGFTKTRMFVLLSAVNVQTLFVNDLWSKISPNDAVRMEEFVAIQIRFDLGSNLLSWIQKYALPPACWKYTRAKLYKAASKNVEQGQILHWYDSNLLLSSSPNFSG